MSESYNTLVSRDQGGNSITTKIGGYVGACGPVAMAVGAESANTITVTATFTRPNGSAMDRIIRGKFWLSDSPTNASIAATAASGGIAAGASGFVTNIPVTGKMVEFVTNSVGVAVFVTTHTGVGTYYPCIVLPSGEVAVGAAMVFA